MINDFISLFFPRYCIACREALVKGERLICIKCDHELPKIDTHHQSPNFIEEKFYGRVRIKNAEALYLFHQQGRVQQLLHHIKYNNGQDLAELLGEKLGLNLTEQQLFFNYDAIIPVPLHRKKLRRRGYNQSERFANGLSTQLAIPVKTNLLIRDVATATQTRKSRIERWQNVGGIFSVKNEEEIKSKKLLLVDDVITTGATLESAAICLLEAGAAEISLAGLAAAK